MTIDQLVEKGEWELARAASRERPAQTNWENAVRIDDLASLMLGDRAQAESCYRLLHERYARARPGRLKAALRDLVGAGERGAGLLAWFGVLSPLTGKEVRDIETWWGKLAPEWKMIFQSELADTLEEPRLEKNKGKLDILELAAIRELPRVRIRRERTVSTLSPLRDLPNLREFKFRGAYQGNGMARELAVLGALEELHLGRVTQKGTLADAGALAALTRLRALEVGDAIDDVSFMVSLPHLESFAFKFGDNGELPTLPRLPALRSIDVGRAACRSLQPMALCDGLERVRMSYALRLVDISALADLPRLRELFLINASALKEIGSVQRMTRLAQLDLSFTEISSLAPLAGHPALEWLNIGFSQVTDLTPLATCPKLRWLDAEFENSAVRGHREIITGCPALERVTVLPGALSRIEQASINRARPGVLYISEPDRT